MDKNQSQSRDVCHKEFNYKISDYLCQNFDWLVNGKINVIAVELMLF